MGMESSGVNLNFLLVGVVSVDEFFLFLLAGDWGTHGEGVRVWVWGALWGCLRGDLLVGVVLEVGRVMRTTVSGCDDSASGEEVGGVGREPLLLGERERERERE